ncbi:MARVEL domain-containing protein [Aphelenchoides fujianensis]|nr:MARVEL domain-containing protein [Aphelenchoides fujianensis]
MNEPRQTYSIQATRWKRDHDDHPDEVRRGHRVHVRRRPTVRAASSAFLQIIVGLIIVCLICSVFGAGPFKGILFGQTFLLIFTAICLCISFMFLLAFFFRLFATHLHFWPWHVSDFIFSLTAAIFFLIMGFLEAYYATGAWSNNCNDIGGDGIIHNGCRTIIEWAFASFFCFLNAILWIVGFSGQEGATVRVKQQ